MSEIMNIKEASVWASNYFNKNITTSNISYLIQYGKIPKILGSGKKQIKKDDLIHYYEYSLNQQRKWQGYCGEELNWNLSFSQYKEAETTKHIHRLHPYKGKFSPQLVEYFLDDHTDTLKKEVFFKKGDTILDPFCGSGTTLIQANELGMNGIGIDISIFNAQMTNAKLTEYSLPYLEKHINLISDNLKAFSLRKKSILFEKELLEELKVFNHRFFPSPDFKIRVRKGELGKDYFTEKEKEFLRTYEALIKKYKIKLIKDSQSKNFLDKWFVQDIREELDFVLKEIKKVKDKNFRRLLSIILSRTTRSCRATRHSDLATLVKPQIVPYYCKKHGKICKPLFSILNWWNRYTKDTIKRLYQFQQLKTKTKQFCLTGDSRQLNIFSELKKHNFRINKEIDGIFSSPPYLGLIDYHEQHSYAYDLFNLERKGYKEIGPLFKGQGQKAKEAYINDIVMVLNNSKKFLKKNFDIFLVANDKYNLYPKIAQLAQMKIVNQYKRPVLNRTEKDKKPYAETIFHFKNIQ